ncbi:hypothetical protein E2C11_14955 [Streptomyces lavendulae]|nr:hypothetical protein [Streptomyces lavendulae]TXJ78785.1 hypothetical protein E2C11_14955 [Streptomyces lavendulae]
MSAHTERQQVGIYTDWDSHSASGHTLEAGQIAAAYRAWQSGTGRVRVTVHALAGRVVISRHF